MENINFLNGFIKEAGVVGKAKKFVSRHGLGMALGATSGALKGSVIGNAIKDKKTGKKKTLKGALIGAGVGAVVGTGVSKSVRKDDLKAAKAIKGIHSEHRKTMKDIHEAFSGGSERLDKLHKTTSDNINKAKDFLNGTGKKVDLSQSKTKTFEGTVKKAFLNAFEKQSSVQAMSLGAIAGGGYGGWAGKTVEDIINKNPELKEKYKDKKFTTPSMLIGGLIGGLSSLGLEHIIKA